VSNLLKALLYSCAALALMYLAIPRVQNEFQLLLTLGTLLYLQMCAIRSVIDVR
jgi:hypothetical protein